MAKITWNTNQWFSLWWQMTIRIGLLALWWWWWFFLNDRMVFSFLKAISSSITGNTIVALILALFFPVSTYTYYLLLTYPEYILGGHVQNMKMVFNISTLSDGLGIQQQNLIFFFISLHCRSQRQEFNVEMYYFHILALDTCIYTIVT